jgi:hypothetical protein
MLSIVISVLALTVAAAALYRTHLAPFSPVAVVGVLRLRVYPWSIQGREWVIASIHLTLSVANEGARTGIVDSLRVVVRYRDADPPDNFETFGPVVVLAQSLGITADTTDARREWLDKSPEWGPLLVLPKQTVTQHLVFESGPWYKRVFQPMEITLEMHSSASADWVTVEQWTLQIDRDSWPHLLGGSAYPGRAASWVDMGAPARPEDLNERLGGPPVKLS